MSVSTEVQRTLVKSPPELWAELGSADGLARHLGELGEIRVTKAEPETRVEWEADRASGVVELKQSGWGTRVTLSVTRELPPSEADAVEPESIEPTASEDSESAAESQPAMRTGAAEPEPATASGGSEPEPAAASGSSYPEPAAVTEAVRPRPATSADAAEPGATPEADPVGQEPEPTTVQAATVEAARQGFFARLFKRRRSHALEATREQTAESSEAEPEPAVEPAPHFEALALPEPVYPDPPPKPPVSAEPAVDLAAELADVEAQIEQESTELLTGVLDRLGAAHHRPFSRA